MYGFSQCIMILWAIYDQRLQYQISLCGWTIHTFMVMNEIKWKYIRISLNSNVKCTKGGEVRKRGILILINLKSHVFLEFIFLISTTTAEHSRDGESSQVKRDKIKIDVHRKHTKLTSHIRFLWRIKKFTSHIFV